MKLGRVCIAHLNDRRTLEKPGRLPLRTLTNLKKERGQVSHSNMLNNIQFMGKKTKSKSHATPAFSPGAAAQPGAQGDAGLRFGLFPSGSARPRPLARALGFLITPH